MSVVFESSEVTLHHGDCLDVLATLPDCSVDSVVTDPPYGLANTDPAHVVETITRWVNGERDYLPGGKGFMGKAWDAFVPPVAVWDECLRVLKPGGHLLAFAGSRTDDLMGLSIRLAGFEIRDGIAWLYGSGFPKSMDVAKAIDKVQGVEGSYGAPKSAAHAAHIGKSDRSTGAMDPGWDRPWMHDADAIDRQARTYEGGSPEAQAFTGWGTALKPAFEPIVVARKPLGGSTVAANVLKWGTGALNIDATRIGGNVDEMRGRSGTAATPGGNAVAYRAHNAEGGVWEPSNAGRFPANVILDDHTATELDQQSGNRPGFSGGGVRKREGRLAAIGSGLHSDGEHSPYYGDSGGASRFFYTAKADSTERPVVDGVAHPTVKPLDLMRWLVRLVTPKGGTVLEPFAGSGTTLEAAVLEGFRAIGIEREADYIPLIEQRLDKPHEVGLDLFGDVA